MIIRLEIEFSLAMLELVVLMRRRVNRIKGKDLVQIESSIEKKENVTFEVLNDGRTVKNRRTSQL